MRSPSRHALPRLPRRQPDWRRAGTVVMRGTAKLIYWGALILLGTVCAFTTSSGTNGLVRMGLAYATVAAVVFGGHWVLTVARMVLARIPNMIITW